ncbi:arabinofuranosidase catalytic domain-containing protein [Pelomonas sp. Root1217]|uniref:arabinofuranosidase catalytic domain-containing protein n=1 Tax=Pelomonas sp. Root1217 TaxID=1736430 RepID=UPI0009EA9F55|nr:arabinofuranosidase catalytic domain-containing protein [Pelomonas sp. Root1217]
MKYSKRLVVLSVITTSLLAGCGGGGGNAPPPAPAPAPTPTPSAAQRPCDIYAAGGTPCVAAHSTTRVLLSTYTGPLYQVLRQSDSATLDVTALSNGIANAALQDAFCTGATCLISVIYDQSGRNNHLTQAPPGFFKGPAAGGYDNLAVANAAPLTLSGQKVYGVYIPPGTGYRNNATNGIAVGDQPEGMYAALDGWHFNSACCFDYGNAETSSTDTGNGHMETIYFGNQSAWGTGAGPGPWIMADLENGLFSGRDPHLNANDPTITSRFVTAIVKGEPNHWAIRGGNTQAGSLSTFNDGVRPSGGYTTMSKEGAIVLGIGGDNSNGGRGTFYEGAMTSGYPSDATEDAVQANLVAAKYAVDTSTTLTGRAIKNEYNGLCLDDHNSATAAGSPVVQWTCNGSAAQQWNIVPAADGYVTIVNVKSGLCLDDTDGKTAPGSTIQQYTCNGQAVQQWRLVNADGGQLNIVNRNSNLCLDDFNGGKTPGAEVRQWQCTGGVVQWWSIL